MFSNIGKKLSALHVNYEKIKKYPLRVEGLNKNNLKVKKMRFANKNNNCKIIYNEDITISNIPEEAYQYEVSGKSAIWWIMNRYQEKTDEDSGISKDPNSYSENPKYIIDLLQRIVSVGVESARCY